MGIRAELFAASAISDETAAFNAAMAERMKGAPNLWDIGVSAARSGGFMPAPPPSPRSRTEAIGAGLSLHVVPAAAEPRGVYLHIHGGGMVLGSASAQDRLLERIADHVGVTCVSVEYSLAPEHPYPKAWDECEAAALWLIDNAEARFGSPNLLIGGESAGAMLAVATLRRLRDRASVSPFLGANLSFGVYDSSMTPSQRMARTGVLSADQIAKNAAAYAPDLSQHRLPDISPLYSDLSGLPPALFTVGTLDAMLDDSMFMYARWLASGNRAEIAIYPGADHAFIEVPHPLAPVANARIDSFLSGCLAE